MSSSSSSRRRPRRYSLRPLFLLWDHDGVLYRASRVPKQFSLWSDRLICENGRILYKGAHQFDRDRDTGLCQCGLPQSNRWHISLVVSGYDPRRLATGEHLEDD